MERESNNKIEGKNSPFHLILSCAFYFLPRRCIPFIVKIVNKEVYSHQDKFGKLCFHVSGSFLCKYYGADY